jgi:hypothetical protein
MCAFLCVCVCVQVTSRGAIDDLLQLVRPLTASFLHPHAQHNATCAESAAFCAHRHAH